MAEPITIQFERIRILVNFLRAYADQSIVIGVNAILVQLLIGALVATGTDAAAIR